MEIPEIINELNRIEKSWKDDSSAYRRNTREPDMITWDYVGSVKPRLEGEEKSLNGKKAYRQIKTNTWDGTVMTQSGQMYKTIPDSVLRYWTWGGRINRNAEAELKARGLWGSEDKISPHLINKDKALTPP